MEPDVAMSAVPVCGRSTILIVDDSAEMTTALSAVLSKECDIVVVQAAEIGVLRRRVTPLPELILLASGHPEMGGLDLCRQLQASPSTCGIPVILVCAEMDSSIDEAVLGLGAVDIITVPVSPSLLLARVRNHLKLGSAALLLKDHRAYLEGEVCRRTREMQAIQEVTIMVLASLAETRDVDTGNHIRRTQLYVKALARQLATDPRFAAQLDEHTIELICLSAPLHDIGKVGIPDAVLRKQARLRPEEFELVKTHTRLGRDAIEHAEMKLGRDVPFLRFAKEIAFCHQEKWDGSGYPQGLKGAAIPLCARLMALADVYDALISRRVYREPIDHDEAVRLILEGRGSHFDPAVVDAFATIADSFRAIASAHADEESRTENRYAPLRARVAVPQQTHPDGTHNSHSSR